MVAAARDQALGLDRGQEAAGGAVIEQGGWRLGDVAHFHLGAAMALGGADATAIVGEGETALVIGLDHFTQGVQVEGMTLPAGAVDQRVNIEKRGQIYFFYSNFCLCMAKKATKLDAEDISEDV